MRGWSARQRKPGCTSNVPAARLAITSGITVVRGLSQKSTCVRLWHPLGPLRSRLSLSVVLAGGRFLPIPNKIRAAPRTSILYG
jgi:hypothetical protein